MHIAKKQLAQQLDKLEQDTRQLVGKYTRHTAVLSQSWYKTASLEKLKGVVNLFLVYYIEEYGSAAPIPDCHSKTVPSGWKQCVTSLHGKLVDKCKDSSLTMPYLESGVEIPDEYVGMINVSSFSPRRLLKSTSVAVYRNYIANNLGEELALFIFQFIEKSVCSRSKQAQANLEAQQTLIREKFLIEHYVTILHPTVYALIQHSQERDWCSKCFDVFGLEMQFECISAVYKDQDISTTTAETRYYKWTSIYSIATVVLKEMNLLICRSSGGIYRKSLTDLSNSIAMVDFIQWINDGLDVSTVTQYTEYDRLNFLQKAVDWIQQLNNSLVQIGQKFPLVFAGNAYHNITLFVDVNPFLREDMSTFATASLVPYWYHMHQSYGDEIRDFPKVQDSPPLNLFWKISSSRFAYRMVRFRLFSSSFGPQSAKKDKERMKLINYMYSLITEQYPKIQTILIEYIVVQTVCELILHYV